MQKKQIKILGYQAENCKIKLFYETDGEKSRYIVEKNRKYIICTSYIEVAKGHFKALIYDNINQLKLNI